MDGMTLFGLASRRAQWLSDRQAVVAQNVANAQTPDYKSKDLAPFDQVFEQTQLKMSLSSPMHLAANGAFDPGPKEVTDTSAATRESGNSVSLENEMLKAGEISRDYSLDTSIVKAFNRMILMTVKS